MSLLTSFVSSRTLAVSLVVAPALLSFAVPASAQLPTISSRQTLAFPPDPAPEPPGEQPTRFGQRVFTDGKTAIFTVDRGRAAYAYVKSSGGNWVHQAALAAPEGQTSVGAAILGDTAVVQGVTADNKGKAFVFHRSQNLWTHTQTLDINPSGAVSGSNDLNYVALGEDFLALGHRSFNGAEGGVDIYSKVGAGSYVYDTTLQVADPTEGTLYGVEPAISGDTLVAAAPGYSTLNVFVRTGGIWTEQAALSRPEQFVTAHVVSSLDRNRLVMGASSRLIDDPAGPIVFVRKNGAWTQQQELVDPNDPAAYLGFITAIDGRRLVAMAHESDTAYLYERNGSTWTAVAELPEVKRSACTPSDEFLQNGPVHLAISGRTLFASCLGHPADPGAPFGGRVLVYKLPALD